MSIKLSAFCLLAVGATIATVSCSQEKPAISAVTWSDYQKIAPGMSYAQVRGVLRQPGRQVSGQDIDGHLVRTLSFGRAGSDCLIQFDGDKVIEKYTISIQPPSLESQS